MSFDEDIEELTLRDYFAGKALGAILSRQNFVWQRSQEQAVAEGNTTWQEIYDNEGDEELCHSCGEAASAAYIIADRMLSQRLWKTAELKREEGSK